MLKCLIIVFLDKKTNGMLKLAYYCNQKTRRFATFIPEGYIIGDLRVI